MSLVDFGVWFVVCGARLYYKITHSMDFGLWIALDCPGLPWFDMIYQVSCHPAHVLLIFRHGLVCGQFVLVEEVCHMMRGSLLPASVSLS